LWTSVALCVVLLLIIAAILVVILVRRRRRLQSAVEWRQQRQREIKPVQEIVDPLTGQKSKDNAGCDSVSDPLVV